MSKLSDVAQLYFVSELISMCACSSTSRCEERRQGVCLPAHDPRARLHHAGLCQNRCRSLCCGKHCGEDFPSRSTFLRVCVSSKWQKQSSSQIKRPPPICSYVLTVHDAFPNTVETPSSVLQTDVLLVFARHSELVPTRRLQLNQSSRVSCRLLHSTSYQLFFDSTCACYVGQTFPGCFETAGRPTPF